MNHPRRDADIFEDVCEDAMLGDLDVVAASAAFADLGARAVEIQIGRSGWAMASIARTHLTDITRDALGLRAGIRLAYTAQNEMMNDVIHRLAIEEHPLRFFT